MIMRTTAAMLAILSFLIGGCAAYHSDDTFVREALQERDAAYIRGAKAITHYCAVSTDTPDSRQACILERRLSLLQVEHPQPIQETLLPPDLSASR
jgi:hypothetical protein